MHLVTTAVLSALGRLTPYVLLDIFLTAFLIYQFFIMIRGRRAAHAFAGLSVLVLLYVFALYLNLELLRTLLATLAPYSVFGLMVLFRLDVGFFHQAEPFADLAGHEGF